MSDKRQTKRVFDEEFRQDAVKLVTEENYSIAKAAKALGVSQGALRNWLKKASKEETPSSEQNLQEENRRLKKQLRQAEMERDILKKATAYFAKQSK